MIVISLAVIVALAVICLYQSYDNSVQKKRARIARGRYKEGQAILAEMDLAHQREGEHLRRDLHLAESALSKERQLKHGFKRSCEKLKAELDDKCDEVESLRAALESANGTIREMMEDRASGGAELSASMESLSRAARAFREAAGGADG